MKHAQLGSIRARLAADAFARCIPLDATLELTLACNLRCVHCYNFDRAAPQPKLRGDELTPPELQRVIDELADAGTLYLSLTGGEALLHPHLDELVAHGARRGLVVRVKSNATLLTVERARRLAAAGAHAVDVSVYGARAQTHDAFTLAPGSFARTVEGTRAALAAGLTARLSFCVTRHNAAEIADMIALAEELGVAYGFDPQLTARYDGTRSSLDHRVDRETLTALYAGPLAHLVAAQGDCATDSVQCSCARSVCGISSTGEVYPCIGAPLPSGNLRQRSFAEIWRDSPTLNRIRALTLDDFPACKPCPDRDDCRRSSGVVYLNTGDYTGAEPWTCMEASVLHQLRITK
jgi:radical SAM protein with 4Fe4S-binding SPASM domain